MRKWWRARTRQEKWMAALIVLLAVCIVVRWEYVGNEAGSAFKGMFTRGKTKIERVEPVREGDSR